MSVLRLRDVAIAKGTNMILEGIDLDLPAGARHIITGHNGAGKTTLLDAIGGQAQAAGGRIWLDGVDITTWPPHRRARRGLARTWQHPMLCTALTIAEHLNLAHGPADPYVDELLDLFGLAELREQRVAVLSYGKQRCLELVLALTTRPRLLLLDEPSAGLSPSELNTMMSALSVLDPRTTLLLTDHHPEVIATVATSATHLVHGRLTADPRSAVQRRPIPSRSGTREALQTALHVESLWATYGTTNVLHEVACTVLSSQIMAIIGGNGAGKTTLLNAIAGVGGASVSGTIHLGGQVVSQMPPWRRQQLGLSIVPQDRRLFARLTVAENLRLPRGGVGREQHPAALLFAQLQGRQRQKAGTLSGGERQMLAFARAVVSQPKVLLLDEPFEGLAASATQHMRQTIAQLAQSGVAIVIADHRLDNIEALADQVSHLVDGGLVAA